MTLCNDIGMIDDKLNVKSKLIKLMNSLRVVLYLIKRPNANHKEISKWNNIFLSVFLLLFFFLYQLIRIFGAAFSCQMGNRDAQ